MSACQFDIIHLIALLPVRRSRFRWLDWAQARQAPRKKGRPQQDWPGRKNVRRAPDVASIGGWFP